MKSMTNGKICLTRWMTKQQKMSENNMELYEKVEKERQAVAYAMKQYGGSFVKALGDALLHADIKNVARIKTAFPDYYYEYLAISKRKDKEKSNEQ